MCTDHIQHTDTILFISCVSSSLLARRDISSHNKLCTFVGYYRPYCTINRRWNRVDHTAGLGWQHHAWWDRPPARFGFLLPHLPRRAPLTWPCSGARPVYRPWDRIPDSVQRG